MVLKVVVVCGDRNQPGSGDEFTSVAVEFAETLVAHCLMFRSSTRLNNVLDVLPVDNVHVVDTGVSDKLVVATVAV